MNHEMKANTNQSADGMRELSKEEMNLINGGKMNETDRETFIKILYGHKQAGWDKYHIQIKFNIPDLLEVIEEVWDTL